MRVFRYMPRRYAEAAVEHGRLRLSTFQSVVALESKLADPHDGAFIRRDSHHHISGVMPLDEQARWRRMGVGIEGDVKDLQLSITHVSQSNGYMLCCTDRPDNAHLRAAAPDNDTVLEISDLGRFVREVTRRDPILRALAAHPAGPGRTRVIVGRVVYGTIEGDRYSDDEAHPLKKAARFAPEREVRAAWSSASRTTEPLDIEVPKIRKLLRIL